MTASPTVLKVIQARDGAFWPYGPAGLTEKAKGIVVAGVELLPGFAVVQRNVGAGGAGGDPDLSIGHIFHVGAESGERRAGGPRFPTILRDRHIARGFRRLVVIAADRDS